MADSNTVQLSRTLLKDMQIWARSLGFQQLGVSDIDLSAAEDQLQQWLARGFHGEMEFMQRHGSLRTHPEELMPGTIRVITARMDYWPETASDAWQVMGESELGFISRYALGRDYHKLIRKRLLRLSKRIEGAGGVMGYRDGKSPGTKIRTGLDWQTYQCVKPAKRFIFLFG